jgi:hypothetical protein
LRCIGTAQRNQRLALKVTNTRRYKCEMNLEPNGRRKNAESIMGVMMLADSFILIGFERLGR